MTSADCYRLSCSSDLAYVACERIFRELGRTDEAYARYGRDARQKLLSAAP